MPGAVAGKVEDDRLIFAWRQTKRSSDHLQIERKARGRAQQDRPDNRRNVDTFGDQAAVRQNVQTTVAEASDKGPALNWARVAIDMRRLHARGAEARGDRLAMLDVDAKHDCGLAAQPRQIFVNGAPDDD